LTLFRKECVPENPQDSAIYISLQNISYIKISYCQDLSRIIEWEVKIFDIKNAVGKSVTESKKLLKQKIISLVNFRNQDWDVP
jgi:hypothetical protein